MRRTRIVTAIVTAGLLVPAVRADVIHVPADYPDIRSAVDAASAGDEIVLASGTYRGPGNRGISFNGKPLTVRSATRNPADVVIRCDGLDRAFRLSTGDGGSVFEGLHIVDGAVGIGGSGGAMLIGRADVEIIRCHFTNNSAMDLGGGAIRSDLNSLTLRECRFRANRAELGGAILALMGGELVVDRCEFLGNEADCGGGAISVSKRFIVTNSVFSGNHGGHCRGGGALSLHHGYPSVVANCVISRNTTDTDGGGIHLEDTATVRVVNSILWGNEDRSGTGETAQIDLREESRAVVLGNCIQGTWTGEGFANIGTNPRMVDADGPDNVPGTLDDNCRLRGDSPCIDAGLNLPIALDFDGNRRVVDRPAAADTGFGVPFVIDMGMHEYGSRPPCPGDVDDNGSIGFDDLLLVLGGWGVCR